MKIKPFLFFFIVLSTACSSDKQEGSLPYIDVTKNYPEKEIILTDIADVTYLCLNSNNDDCLYNGRVSCVTKNTIVIMDTSNDFPSGKILLFSKDGTPKSQFNNRGQGPREYSSLHKVIFDEEADEVFVYSMAETSIMVYSSIGEYKRKIVLPSGFGSNSIYSFDNESLLIYDGAIVLLPGKKREITEETDYPVKFYNHPFVRISKTDGKVLEYVKLPSNETELVFHIERDKKARIMTNPIIHTEKGFLLCNPETDTVFLYNKNKVLTPVICKTPLVKNLNPMIVMNNCLDYGGYQFMNIITLQYSPELIPAYPIKYLIRNKKTGEVYRQKITLPDYKDKEFIIGNRVSQIYDEGVFFELELTELKQADRENKLSGKLKELVATLNEDEDNNVFMFVDFK
jgi:hypothetical protein